MSDLIYRDYNQEELDLEYDMRRRCPNFAEVLASMEPHTERAISNFECRIDVAFGEKPGEKLDIWPGRGGAPILLFIHGGYWKTYDKNMFSFVAERFVEAGACVILNNYDLCPSVRMDEIIRQNRAAIAWIYKNANTIGGDPGRIHVTGHSAGGHLTAMTLATDWEKYGLPFDVVNGAVPLSGLFDLEPIRLSYLNAELYMDKDESHRNSPIHNIPKWMPPTVVAVGGGETDEFRRQSRIYTDACRNAGFDVSYLEVRNSDHVSVPGEYRNKLSPLTAVLFSQMGL
tara:strand:+ start:1040 stop:1897 length:858 start_codon:yes stop_codon:yes gene_type:complete